MSERKCDIFYDIHESADRANSAARGKKVEVLKTLYSAYPSVEVVEITDLVVGQFGDALNEVHAVIHTATAMPGQGDTETVLKVRTHPCTSLH